MTKNDLPTFPAADLARRTGDLFEAAARRPVAITKHRRPRFVVMSMAQYEALTREHGLPRAYATAELPPDLGRLLDDAIAQRLEEPREARIADNGDDPAPGVPD